MKHYKSVFENEQELLKAIIDIHGIMLPMFQVFKALFKKPTSTANIVLKIIRQSKGKVLSPLKRTRVHNFIKTL